jgi:leishmanolysin-like peptidase
VVPVSGVLRADRFCTSNWGSGKCASQEAPTCGIVNGGSAHEIPASMLAELETCATCYTSGACDDCTTHAAGDGVAETDFVLFVAAVTTSACGTVDSEGRYSGTLAYASTCERDQHDRPIFG